MDRSTASKINVLIEGIQIMNYPYRSNSRVAVEVSYKKSFISRFITKMKRKIMLWSRGTYRERLPYRCNTCANSMKTINDPYREGHIVNGDVWANCTREEYVLRVDAKPKLCSVCNAEAYVNKVVYSVHTREYAWPCGHKTRYWNDENKK